MQRLGVGSVDLGALDGPVLLFGGPYGNLQATQALRARAATMGITPDRVICTGDVVAYCAHPQETVDLIRDWGIAVVMGNCEESLAEGAADCGCGFEAGSACDALSEQWYAHARAALGAGATAWMAGLPRAVRFTLNGVRFAAIHGAVTEISRFVFASTPAPAKAADLDRLGVDAVVGGHSGLPFEHRLPDGRLWLNAGVIGMPANDGTARVWYAVAAPGPDGAIAVHRHALAYDHPAAARAMRRDGLPEAYAACLETGLWPNLDVLPAAERATQGAALGETAMIWRPGDRHTRAAE